MLRISPEELRLRQEEEDNRRAQFKAAGGPEFDQTRLEAAPIKHALMPFRRAFAEKVSSLSLDRRRYLGERLSWMVLLRLPQEATHLIQNTYSERSAVVDALWLTDLLNQMGVPGLAEYIERDDRYLNDNAVWDYERKYSLRREEAPPLVVAPARFSVYRRYRFVTNNFYAHYCAVYDAAGTIGWIFNKGIEGEITQRTNELFTELGIQGTEPDLDIKEKYLTYFPVEAQLLREGYGVQDLRG